MIPGIEFLIIYVVVPLARRMGERAIDAAAGKMDQRLWKILSDVVRTDVNSHEEKEALERARTVLENDPALVGKAKRLIVEWPAASAKTSAGEVPPTRNQELVYATYVFMTFILDRVAYLERPVALPGFLTGPEWVVVIDTRLMRKSDTLWMPLDPLPSRLSPGREYLHFLHNHPKLEKIGRRQGKQVKIKVPLVSAVAEDASPRILLLQAPDPDPRKKLVAMLEEGFKDIESVPSLEELGEYVREKAGGDFELLDTIDADRIYVFTPRPKEDPYTPTNCVGRGEKRYTIGRDTRGVTSMRNALLRALEARYKSDKKRVNAQLGTMSARRGTSAKGNSRAYVPPRGQRSQRP